MRLEVAAVLIAVPIVLGPILWPRGIVVKSEKPFINGTLTEFKRVSGVAAVRAWWRGELQREPSE